MIEHPKSVRSRRGLERALAPEKVADLVRFHEHEHLLDDGMELYCSPLGKLVELPKDGIEEPYEEGSIHTSFEAFQAFYQAMEGLLNEEDQHAVLFAKYYRDPHLLNEVETDALAALGITEPKSDEAFDLLSRWFRKNLSQLRGPFPSTADEKKLALEAYFHFVVAFGALLRFRTPDSRWEVVREGHFDEDAFFVPTLVLINGSRLDFVGQINKAIFDPKPGMGAWEYLASFARSLGRSRRPIRQAKRVEAGMRGQSRLCLNGSKVWSEGQWTTPPRRAGDMVKLGAPNVRKMTLQP